MIKKILPALLLIPLLLIPAFAGAGTSEQLIHSVAMRGSQSMPQLHAYLRGIEADRAGNTKAALSWYARAAGSSAKPESAEAFLKAIPRKKSALYNAALLKAAKTVLYQGKPNITVSILDELQLDNKSHFYIPSQLLRIDALAQTDISEAVSLFEKLSRESENPEILLRQAILSERKGNMAEAAQLYLKTLSYPQNDSTYLQAARALSNLPATEKEAIGERQIRLAEFYRIEKQYAKADAEMLKVQPEQLEKNLLYYYLKNYTRLLIDTRRYSNAVKIIRQWGAALDDSDRSALLSDASERLIKPDRYADILSIVPEKYSGREAMYNRIIALYKENAPSRAAEAHFFLTTFDKDSYYADKTYFSECLDYLLAKDTAKATACLLSLREATRGSCSGGKARFHLARLAEEKGDSKAAEIFYREVYLNSPGSYWVKESFEKSSKEYAPFKAGDSVETLRLAVAQSGGNEQFLREYFSLKRKDADFAVDPFWKQWEKDLSRIFENATEEEKLAALFIAADQYNEGMALLRHTPADKKYLMLYQVGKWQNSTLRKHYYLREYLKAKKFQPDIFFMSREAIESFYPVPYREHVKEAHQKYNVDEALVYAIMKQESMFNPRARSYADARGLMQLLPSTAKALNHREKIPGLNLYRPRDNILLGSKFISDLFSHYSPLPEKMAVAYNAGPGRLRDWNRVYSGDIFYFIEQIPFQQTHHYVKVVRREYDRYAYLLDYYYQ